MSILYVGIILRYLKTDNKLEVSWNIKDGKHILLN